MSQARKSNGQFGKKVKQAKRPTPLPSRKRVTARKVGLSDAMIVEYLLSLAEFSVRLLRRIEALEVLHIVEKFPQDISKYPQDISK